MKIHIHEITDHETDLDFTQGEDWVRTAVESVDETAGGADEAPSARTQPRKIEAHFSLRKVDEVIVVRGEVRTQLHLLCSRCATPFFFNAHPQFSALFCQDPVMAGVAHLEDKKPAGQTKGFARHEHDSGSDDHDLDITYLSGDEINLKEILAEQLQLQVPFQPLCKEACQGICSNCGADLNAGRCACAKINRASPFAALKNFPKKSLKSLKSTKSYAKSDS